MPKSKRAGRQSNREGTRQKIARGAIRALRTHSWDDVGTREVAAEAGLSLGQLHYYFESKEALLLAAAQLFFDEQLEEFLQRIEGKSALDLVRSLIQGSHFSGNDPDGVARMRIQAEARIRSLRDPAFAPVVIRYRRALRDAVQEALTTAGLPDRRAQAVAIIVLDFLESFTPHRLQDSESMDVRQVEKLFLEMVKREIDGAIAAVSSKKKVTKRKPKAARNTRAAT